MASRETQISAFISATTKQLLESHVRATGEKKGHVIEVALRHYLLALQELPADVLIPPRIVVSREAGDRILEEMRSSEATPALRALMGGHGD